MSYKISSNTVIDSTSNADVNNIFYENRFGNYISQAQGLNYGYNAGGLSAPTTYRNNVDRFPFATGEANSTDVGDLSAAASKSGTSSSEYSYALGGTLGPAYSDAIERFAFGSLAISSSDVGDLLAVKNATSCQSSTTYGYSSGGLYNPASPAHTDVIERFPFADATTNATDVGDLTESRASLSSQSSTTHGYASGGFISPTIDSPTIDRFPFADATTNASDVGDVLFDRYNNSGHSSYNYGYVSGGLSIPAIFRNHIERFPFASATTNSVDVGDLTVARYSKEGISSGDFGYHTGGVISGGTYVDTIDFFPFAADVTDANDVGDMTLARLNSAGTQY